MSSRLPMALSAVELSALCAVPKNVRDQAFIAVMAGCGLRVSEGCNLTMDDIAWSGGTPSLRFTGKRAKERVVPMNLEVQDALRAWLQVRGTGGSPYVFCNLRTGERLDRKTVWKALKRYARKAGLRHVHPHMLRHTFGTSLADRDVPVERIRELMGHEKIETSKVYIAVSAEQKQGAVDRLDRRSRFRRWLSRQQNRHFCFEGRPRVRPGPAGLQTVGRQAELRRLQENVDRGIDTLLIGPVGVGKSHLLGLLRGDRIVRLNGLTPVRQAVMEIAEALHRQGQLREARGKEEEMPRTHSCNEGMGRPSKPEEGKALPQTAGETSVPSQGPADGDASGADTGKQEAFEAVRRRHARTGIQGWTQMVLDSVEPNAWTLVIDDLSDLSTSSGRQVDRLSRKFTIVAGLREVRPVHERHFWKFDRVTLNNLASEDARQLLRQCSSGVEVEDARLFETKVLQQGAGNPRAIVEMVDRLRKEGTITRSAVRDLIHTGARPRIDLTPALMLLGIALISARIVARGLGNIEVYIVTGIGATVAMGLRFFLYRGRR